MQTNHGLKMLLCLLAVIGLSYPAMGYTPIQLQGGTVTFEQTEDVVVNTAEHLNFPFVERFYDGEIWLYYSYGQHQVDEKPGFRWSLDNGAIWSYPPMGVLGMNVVQNTDGYIVGVQINSNGEYKTTHSLRFRTWNSPTTPGREVIKDVTFPFSCTAFAHRSLVRLTSGKLLQTVFGTKQGESRLSTFLIQSVNNGVTWSYLSTVAGSDDPAIGDEGYNESSLIQLKDGSLLCLIRTGGWYGSPLMQTRSTDEGATWSTPVQIADTGVDPEIVMLSNGTLVATSGRPGVYMLVDFTGTGNNWQRVDVYTSTSTCSYTSLLEVEPNYLMMLYTKSGFSNLWPSPSDGVNRLVKTYVRINKNPADASSLTLLSPNGGEKLTSWSTSPIKWESQGNIDLVRIDYSMDNGATWNYVTSVDNIGMYKWYPWYIPVANSTTCLVRISDANNPAINDVSAQTFRIVNKGHSSGWEGAYECNDHPGNLGWSAYGTNVPIHQWTATTIDGTNGTINVNTYGVYQTPSVIAYWGMSPSFNFSNGSSVEIRCRVPYSDHWSGAGFRFDNRTDANAQLAFMSGQGVMLNGSSTYNSSNFNVADWHVYRVTVENGLANLYIDVPGAKIANVPVVSGINAAALLFGDLTGSFMSNIEIDYIRWTSEGAFPMVAAPLTLTYPNGGEVLTPRSNCKILWNSYDVNVNYVKLEYTIDNGMTWNTITASAANNGAYDWMVPAVNSQQCQIRISNTANPTLNDSSNQNFTISNLLDSSKWEGKYECSVLPVNDGWTPAGTSVPTHQNWSTYVGPTEGAISVDTKTRYAVNSVVSYWYKNPATNFNFTDGCSVEIRARVPFATAVWGSAAMFFDNGSGIRSSIAFIPGSGIQVNGSGAYNPTWLDVTEWHTYRLTVKNNKTTVYIDTPGSRITDANVVFSAAAQRLYFGDLTGSGMSTFEIDYIRWTQQGAFPMSEPLPLVLQTLNGGETLVPGSTAQINWLTNGTIDNVTLEYSANNGNSWTTISTVANTGSYAWTVPQVNSGQCLIRISNASDLQVNDVSDNTFTIQGLPGDANGDGMVDVGDLGILAANYGGSGKTWAQGDFNGDGLVDVGDLGILAANYGSGTNQMLDFNTDYAKAFGITQTEDDSDDTDEVGSTICSGLGLPLIAGLVLMGLMLVKLEE